VTSRNRDNRKLLLILRSGIRYNEQGIAGEEGEKRVLGGTPWANSKKDKALSARISRHLRLLRDHGVIRKLPNQRKYQLTDKGLRLTSAVNALLGASTQKLLGIAA